MIVYLLSFIIFLLTALITYLCWKIYVLLQIVAVFEDDISENIQVLDNVEKSLDGIIGLKMFFDSKDIQLLIKEAMDSIKLAKFHIGKISKRFTDRSKQKYYLIEEVDEFEDKSYPASELFTPQEKNETIAYVERIKSQ